MARARRPGRGVAAGDTPSSISVPPLSRIFPQRLRFAARALRQSPVFALTAIASLGLALALNTTMFALIDAVRHPFVPYPDPEQLATVSFRGGDRERPIAMAERIEAVRTGSRTLASTASYLVIFTTVQAGTAAEDQFVAAVAPGFFDVLGVRPMAGRALGVGDSRGTGAQAAVISFALWNRMLGSRPIDDRSTIDVGGRTYTVVGVMPGGVRFPERTDVWIPQEGSPGTLGSVRIGPVSLARLKPGVTLDDAKRDLEIVAARLSATYGLRNPLVLKISVVAERSLDSTIFWFFQISAAIVLALACANLGAMMLARGLARRREIALRIALGASRRSIAGQVFLECALVVGGGAALGCLLTAWALDVLPHLTTRSVPMLGDVVPRPSWRVFVFVLTVSAAALSLAALLPAMRAASIDPSEPLKEGSASLTARDRHRHHPLVIVEVVLATALLMACALFALLAVKIDSFAFPFPAERMVVAHVRVRPRAVPDAGAAARLYEDVLARAGRLSGVRLAAYHRSGEAAGGVVTAESGTGGTRWTNVRGYDVVGPAYLRMFEMQIVRGRDFVDGDRGSERVAIVDEAGARMLWPGLESPVGRMIKLGGERSSLPWVRVVGVVRLPRAGPGLRAALRPEPTIFVSDSRADGDSRELIVLTDGAGGDRGRAAFMVTLRRELQAMGPSLSPMTRVRPWLEGFAETRSFTTYTAWLLGAFSAFGVALCAVGLYGVLAYSVRSRRREFAIRIALGAPARAVLRLVLREIAVTFLAGIGVGAFAALWLTRAVGEIGAAVPHAEVYALLLAEGILLAATTLAALGPIRQAMRADPAEILRAS